MLTSLVSTLKPLRDGPLPLTSGNFTHACFLNLIRQVDETLAESLHRGSRSQPFTLSPLQGELVNQNGRVLLKKEKEYWFRITSLEENLSRRLGEISQKPPPQILLGDEKLKVKKMTASSPQDNWASTTTYKELYNHRVASPPSPGYTIKMKFYSPTAFRSGGQNIPLPLPNLVFFGLAEKWNRYSPVNLGSDIFKIASQQMAISRCKLVTRILDFGKYRQVGFIGEVEFLIKKKDDLLRRIFHLLADFAFYAGVGYKTTMGMGQTRRI
ncbi:CRISPR-associated endoribonuclease Cas6 [candidate division NPL-UPA2 bacterium]|nr:CRISPR-associated endoribonuclease Cas6 [candidate division NPL-UPA2 bacterium]